jgi:hypothetical protein
MYSGNTVNGPVKLQRTKTSSIILHTIIDLHFLQYMP